MAFKIIIDKPYLDADGVQTLAELAPYNVDLKKVIEYVTTAYCLNQDLEDSERFDFFTHLIEEEMKIDRIEGGIQERMESSWRVSEKMIDVATQIQPQLVVQFETLHAHLNKNHTVDPQYWEPIVETHGDGFEIIINNEPTSGPYYR